MVLTHWKRRKKPPRRYTGKLRERASLGKCLPTHRSEDLSLILNALVKSWMWQSICNSSAWETDIGGSQGLVG